jgi:hypothetical protein
MLGTMVVPMTTHSRFVDHSLPYDGDEVPLPELIADCQCVEDECACHGISLHPPHHDPPPPKLPAPTNIGDATVALVEGCGAYGSGP